MDLELTGKRALVTGGSRGIGKAIAFDLAREGCEVAISARDPGRLAAAAAEIGAEVGREIHWFSAEASDDASIKAMVAGAAAAMGGLDILVNNAASPGSVHGPKPLAELTDEIVLADINVKVMGYLRCTREAAPYMQAAGWAGSSTSPASPRAAAATRSAASATSPSPRSPRISPTSSAPTGST